MPRLPRLLVAVTTATLVLSGTARAQDDPVVDIATPTTHAGVEVGVPVLITGSTLSRDTDAIATTELTFDGGATWVDTELLRVLPGFRTDWRYVYTPDEAGDVTVAGRAVTTSGVGVAGEEITVRVGGTTVPQPVNCQVRCEFLTPYAAEVDDLDRAAVEIGVKTRFDRPGHVLGASLLRGEYRGPITVRLWSDDGALLAEREWDHPGRMAEIDFATPVPVVPDRDYVVSYYTPNGGYATSEYYFSGTVVNAPFTAPHNGAHGAGVYHYGHGGGFPTDSWHDSTYWVQPEFRG